jgi:hypothetical protein
MGKIIDAKSPWATLDWSKFVDPTEDTIIYNDVFTVDNDNRSERKIFFNLEPESIIPTQEYILKNYNKFSHIITFNQTVLDKCGKRGIKYLYGTTWISEKDYNNIDLIAKQYKISIMTGSKCMTVGHSFRIQLYQKQQAFSKFPITFWRSSAGQPLPELNPGNNPLLGRDSSSKINMLATYQFHICIENSRQLNYFTEKLIDCLITKTIPIYYGCPNIAEYFDTTGWIILEDESPSSLFKALMTLDFNYYMKHIDTINKNYEECKKYIDIYKNINISLKASSW